MTRGALGRAQCATQLLDLDDESFMHSATPWPSRRVCSTGGTLTLTLTLTLILILTLTLTLTLR